LTQLSQFLNITVEEFLDNFSSLVYMLGNVWLTVATKPFYMGRENYLTELVESIPLQPKDFGNFYIFNSLEVTTSFVYRVDYTDILYELSRQSYWIQRMSVDYVIRTYIVQRLNGMRLRRSTVYKQERLVIDILEEYSSKCSIIKATSDYVNGKEYNASSVVFVRVVEPVVYYPYERVLSLVLDNLPMFGIVESVYFCVPIVSQENTDYYRLVINPDLRVVTYDAITFFEMIGLDEGIDALQEVYLGNLVVKIDMPVRYVNKIVKKFTSNDLGEEFIYKELPSTYMLPEIVCEYVDSRDYTSSTKMFSIQGPQFIINEGIFLKYEDSLNDLFRLAGAGLTAELGLKDGSFELSDQLYLKNRIDIG
jgi:hypothetical protein